MREALNNKNHPQSWLFFFDRSTAHLGSIPGKSKPAESQVDLKNRFSWIEASHCEDTLSALRNWTEQELNSNSSPPSIYIYVNV